MAGFAEFLEDADLVGDEAGLDGARGAEDNEEGGVRQRALDVGGEVGIGGQLLLIAESARKLLLRGAGRVGPGRGAGTGCEGV